MATLVFYNEFCVFTGDTEQYIIDYNWNFTKRDTLVIVQNATKEIIIDARFTTIGGGSVTATDIMNMVTSAKQVGSMVAALSSNFEAIKTIEYELTRPNDNNDYAAGDAVSNSTTTPELIAFRNAAKSSGKGVIITNIRVQTNDKTKFLGKRFRLHLYRESSVTPITDNAVFQMMYINATKRFGYVDFTLPSAADGGITDSIAVQIDGINKAIQLVGISIYAQLQILDAVTAPVSGAKMYFQMHVIQTN